MSALRIVSPEWLIPWRHAAHRYQADPAAQCERSGDAKSCVPANMWRQRIAAHQLSSVLRQALVLRTAEPISTLASPAPDKPPARQGMFGRLGDPSEPPSLAPASSALTPLVADVGKAPAPPLGEVSVAACDEVGLTDAPAHADPDAAQPVAGANEQDSNRNEQVFHSLCSPTADCLHS